jgi:hypothetical protein
VIIETWADLSKDTKVAIMAITRSLKEQRGAPRPGMTGFAGCLTG